MLALQRDADILECGQVREYSRDLERSHQTEASDIGRRHRRNVLSFIEDLPRRGFEEFGQQVEACRLAGPVRSNQRMDAAAADPKVDVADSKESREFLGQSVGFKNELISQ
jgi:hypothetical protein